MEEATTQAAGPLKRINLETGSFTANGTKYQIESQLSIERYCEMQVLEKELGFGVTFRGMFDKLKAIYTDLNKANFVGASVTVDGMLRGIAKIEEREPIVLKICALFINAEGENRGAWTTDLFVKKINDWKAEGLDMQDFFIVALNSVNGFIGIYNQITEAISGTTGLQEILEVSPKD